MPHSIRSKCHKQISKQKVYGYERPLGLFSSLLLHTAKPQHPGANCTKCHLLLRARCHLALFRKLEQSPGPSCCLGLWQQPRTHDGTSSDTRPNPPSPKRAGLDQAASCSVRSCRRVFLHQSRDLLPTGRKNHHSTWPRPHSDCTGKEPQPSQATEDVTRFVRATIQNCRSLRLGSRQKRNQEALWGISYRLLDK